MYTISSSTRTPIHAHKFGSRQKGEDKRWRKSEEYLARLEMKNCTPLWREAYFEVHSVQTHHARDVEKVHANVMRSTFCKCRCQRNARRCER